MNQLRTSTAQFLRTIRWIAGGLTFVVILASAPVFAQAVSSKSTTNASKSSSAAPKLIQPEELARIVQTPKGDRPLIFHVGYHVLYQQAHIPHSEFIGPASEPQGIQRLRQRVQALPARSTSLSLADAVLGVNVQTLVPHTTNCVPWDSAMSSCSTLRITSARTGSIRVIPCKKGRTASVRLKPESV